MSKKTDDWDTFQGIVHRCELDIARGSWTFARYEQAIKDVDACMEDSDSIAVIMRMAPVEWTEGEDTGESYDPYDQELADGPKMEAVPGLDDD